jgi:choline monooxygenase
MGAPEGTPFPAAERQPGQTVQDLIAARTREFAAGRGVDLD